MILACRNTLRMASGMNQKVGVTIHNTGTFVGGMVVGFYYNWRLTLVIFSFIPVLATAGGMMKVCVWVCMYVCVHHRPSRHLLLRTPMPW